MLLEFVAPLLHDADGGQRRGVAKRAEGAAQHIFGEVADKVDIFRAPEAGVEAIEHLAQPGGAFTAWNAPAAGFVRVEMHDAAGHVHHAGVFVHHHHAAGAEHRAGFGDGVVIHGNVDLGRAEERTGTAAGNDRFQLLAPGNAPGCFVDELLHVHPQRNFVNARLVDVAGDAQHTCAAVSGRAAAGVFLAAFENDGRNGAERFDVINDRRAAVEADDGREGRFNARIAALAFERFHERGFFATFVGTRAGVHDQIKIEAGAEDIVAEVVARIGFVESSLDDVENVAILASNVDEAFRRANRASRNDDAFDHLVWVHLHQRTVLARAGLGFIGIADDVFRLRRILGNERPFHAGREARAAAPAQVGLPYLVDDRLWRHFPQRFFQRLVAVVLQIHIDLVRILDAEAAADDGSLRRIARVQGARGDRFRSWMSSGVEFFDDAIELHGREIFVEVVVDLHGRCAGASTDAFDFFEGE